MAVIKGGASSANLDVITTSAAAQISQVDDTGYSTGRVKTPFTLVATNFTGSLTEALLTLTPSTNWVNGAAATSFTIPAGQRLVILGSSVITKNTAAAGQGIICRIRVSSSGAITLSSSILGIVGAGTTLAVANIVAFGGQTTFAAGWPNMIELSGSQQIGVSQIGTATAGNNFIFWGYLY